jgi:hypothetical protein
MKKLSILIVAILVKKAHVLLLPAIIFTLVKQMHRLLSMPSTHFFMALMANLAMMICPMPCWS